MRFTFGKNKGKEVDEVTSSYLRWFLEKVDEKQHPELFAAVEKEMKYRGKFDLHFD